jgi:periplasmic copper chaperone A
MLRRAFLLLPLATPALAHSYRHGTIAIGHAWALPTRHADGQVFMPLINNGKETDALVAARSLACSYVELRTNVRYDHPAEVSLILDPGKPLPMRPYATHLRLAGLNGPLILGENFGLVLDFELAGEIEVTVHVEKTPGN